MKLKDGFIELYKAGPLTMEKLKAANVAWHDVFEELPIKIQNGNLAKALLAHIEAAPTTQQSDFKELQLGSGPMLLKTLDFMNEFLDDTVAEQQKVGPLFVGNVFSPSCKALDAGNIIVFFSCWRFHA